MVLLDEAGQPVAGFTRLPAPGDLIVRLQPLAEGAAGERARREILHRIIGQLDSQLMFQGHIADRVIGQQGQARKDRVALAGPVDIIQTAVKIRIAVKLAVMPDPARRAFQRENRIEIKRASETDGGVLITVRLTTLARCIDPVGLETAGGQRHTTILEARRDTGIGLPGVEIARLQLQAGFQLALRLERGKADHAANGVRAPERGLLAARNLDRAQNGRNRLPR